MLFRSKRFEVWRPIGELPPPLLFADSNRNISREQEKIERKRQLNTSYSLLEDEYYSITVKSTILLFYPISADAMGFFTGFVRQTTPKPTSRTSLIISSQIDQWLCTDNISSLHNNHNSPHKPSRTKARHPRPSRSNKLARFINWRV